MKFFTQKTLELLMGYWCYCYCCTVNFLEIFEKITTFSPLFILVISFALYVTFHSLLFFSLSSVCFLFLSKLCNFLFKHGINLVHIANYKWLHFFYVFDKFCFLWRFASWEPNFSQIFPLKMWAEKKCFIKQ